MFEAIGRVVPWGKALTEPHEETDRKGRTAKSQDVRVCRSNISIPPGLTPCDSSGTRSGSSSEYRSRASSLKVPFSYPTPGSALSTSCSYPQLPSRTGSISSSSPTPCYQDPSGLSQEELRDQLKHFPTDEKTACALFRCLNHKGEGTEADELLSSFAFDANHRGDKMPASRCYADIAEAWAKQEETSIGAAGLFRIAGEIARTESPKLSGYYETRARVAEARAAHLLGHATPRRETVPHPFFTPTSNTPRSAATPPSSVPKPIHHHTSGFPTGQYYAHQPSEHRKDGESARDATEEKICRARFALSSSRS